MTSASGENKIVVTIDGPGGSGKSTVARKLAKRLGFVHLNSGALYRAVGLEAKRQGVALDDDAAVSRIAASLDFSFNLDAERETSFSVNGRDVRDELRSPAVAELASRVAVLKGVRRMLVDLQRAAYTKHSLVLEGRDAGTVVFPDTPFKFYLDASVDVRAKRRFDELLQIAAEAAKEGGEGVSLEEVRRDLAARDYRDCSREIAPHHKSEDAFLVDTTDLDVDEVVEEIFQMVEAKRESLKEIES